MCAHVLPLLISCPPPGLEDYMKRYGEGITRVLNSFGPVPDFSGGEAAKKIVSVSMMEVKEITLILKHPRFHRLKLKGFSL